MRKTEAFKTLHLFRHLFDNRNRSAESSRTINDFIFSCLNENGLPERVKTVLASHPDFRYFHTAFPQLDVLPPGEISQTSIMAKIRLLDSRERCMVQVECRAMGSFNEKMARSKNGSSWTNKALCERLEADNKEIGHVPFELVDRICSFLDHVIYKGDSSTAIFVIYASGDSKQDFKHFQALSIALDIPLSGPNTLSDEREIVDHDNYDRERTVSLRLAWVEDTMIESAK